MKDHLELVSCTLAGLQDPGNLRAQEQVKQTIESYTANLVLADTSAQAKNRAMATSQDGGSVYFSV